MQIHTFHCGPGGNRQGLKEDYLEKIANAGLMPRIFSVDDYGVVVETLQIADNAGVGAVVAWRPGVPESDGFNWAVPGNNYTQDPFTAAKDYSQRLQAKLPPEFDPRTWIIIWNEIDKYRMEYCAETAIHMTNMLPNLRLAFFSCNAGEPEPEAWKQPFMQQLLKKCENEPERIGICLHEYSFANTMNNQLGWLIGRLNHLALACQDTGIEPGRITTFINEFGYGKDDGTWPGTSTALNELQTIAWPLYNQCKLRVHLVAWWTVHGGTAWGNLPNEVQKIIAPQGDLIVATNAPEKPVPPPGPVEPPEPTPAILKNPSFETGWTDHPQYPDRIQVPNRWQLHVHAPGTVSPFFNSKEGVHPLITGVPEITHKSRDFLPPDDWDLILDGDWTLKATQNVNMVAAVQYSQIITGLVAGDEYELTLPVQIHYQPNAGTIGDDSPDDTQVSITVGVTTTYFKTNPDLPDRQWVELKATGQVNANGDLFIGFGIGTVWQNSRDTFVDDLKLVKVSLPPDQYKVIVLKTPQPHEYTKDEYHELADYAFEKGRTWTASTDDLIYLLENPKANNDSYAELYRPELPSQQEAIKQLEENGMKWEALPDEDIPFDYTRWPTTEWRVTQRFGNNPGYYGQFECGGEPLPGHEGIDMAAAHNSPIYAPASGTISDIRTNPTGHNYGIFVRIDHAEGWQTTLAHLNSVSVSLGQTVIGGEMIGRADSTGNSSGSHLHLTLKRPGLTYTDENGTRWPCSIFDPTPYLEKFNPIWPPEPTPGIDMAPYFLADADAGDIMILKNSWGAGDERVQLQKDGNFSYIVKNQQWEEREVLANRIMLLKDTSPGNNQYYTVNSGTGWMPRTWSPGDRFTRTETTRFYDKGNCQFVSESNWTSDLVFYKFHQTWTSQGNIQLNDVVELLWDLNGEIIERYWYAPGLGLVAWENNQGMRSWINELIPRGSQQDNVRESGCFS